MSAVSLPGAFDSLLEAVQVFIGQLVGGVVNQRRQGIRRRIREERRDQSLEGGTARRFALLHRGVAVFGGGAVAADESLAFEVSDHGADGRVAGGIGEGGADFGNRGGAEPVQDIHNLLLAGGEAALDW
jgi:hypothetical protein